MFRTYRRPVDLLVAAIENFRKGDTEAASNCLSEAASAKDLDETIAELDRMNHKAYSLSKSTETADLDELDELDDNGFDEEDEDIALGDDDDVSSHEDNDDEEVYSSLYRKNRALASHIMEVLGESKDVGGDADGNPEGKAIADKLDKSAEKDNASEVQASIRSRRNLVKANVAALVNSRKTRR